MSAPCKGCPDRCVEPNCHMTCERYLKAKEQLDRAREEKSKWLIAENACAERVIEWSRRSHAMQSRKSGMRYRGVIQK